MKNKTMWIIAAVILLAGSAFIVRNSLTNLFGGGEAVQAQTGQGFRQNGQGDQTADDQQTVTIRPATDTVQVSATGNIELVDQQSAIFKGEGIIAEVFIEEGDEVKVGDLLLSLETDDLERAVRQAEIALEVNRNQLAQLMEPANAAEIEAAQANLASAKESLADLEAGPDPAELAAAEASLAAARASYQELLAGLSEAELTQLATDMRKTYVTLEQAQGEYNKIAYRDNVGESQQAMDLQTATIDYETARAAYEEATASASESEVQQALQSISEAQAQLESLQPTEADLLSAQAEVASAQATLNDLVDGPSETEKRDAELAIEQSQIDLEEAQTNLAEAELRATIDGIVLSVDVAVGQKTTSDLSSALIIGDLTRLALPVYVAEVDINKVELGQDVTIAVDALPDQTFKGTVSRIAPISESDSGVVNYEVVIQLEDLDIEDGVRPGMTAVATILSGDTQNAWLVPSSSLVEFEGETTLLVMRNGQEKRLTVTPAGTSQGEWTVVQSEALQAGDQVMGRVSSFLNEEDQRGFRGFGGPPPR